jgi:hypothetical protein
MRLSLEINTGPSKGVPGFALLIDHRGKKTEGIRLFRWRGRRGGAGLTGGGVWFGAILGGLVLGLRGGFRRKVVKQMMIDPAADARIKRRRQAGITTHRIFHGINPREKAAPMRMCFSLAIGGRYSIYRLREAKITSG